MVTVDLNSSEPLEEQIRREIHKSLALGLVKRGDELPSVRQLAGDLGIHWNTVARAYRRLRDDGLLTVGRGRAVRVRNALLPDAGRQTQQAEFAAQLDGAFTHAKLSGLTYTQLRDHVERQLESWRTAWEEPSV
jgi:DNA-binding transcriptional regulator YhcF (GntR family)